MSEHEFTSFESAVERAEAAAKERRYSEAIAELEAATELIRAMKIRHERKQTSEP